VIRKISVSILLFYTLLGCSSDQDVHAIYTEKIDSGIHFTNTLTSTTELNILNYLYFFNGGGIAAGDFNNDNLVDLYFTSNQEADQLYLNTSDLSFKNITALSQINNQTGWTTGVTTVDINNDNLLDIYVSKVSGHLHLNESNQLFINQGINAEGLPYFKEDAASYNLDIRGLNTQAAFFDYDLDGDLDVYILRHSVHPNSNYGKGALRKKKDALYGDLLLENRNNKYYDVSQKSGIFQGKIGYGLGISTSDLNNDGYPDIYIGNDFFENDYVYINQQDGTFKEIHSSDAALGHSSHFSMGNTISDINNDGKADIISVDMLPQNIETLKTSGTEYNYSIFQNQLRNGYEPQFMQNTLHLNQGDLQFTETAFQSGLAASEWSWSPLIADFNNDGHKDVYITNGIEGATNDMDFVNFISNVEIQKQLGKGMKQDALAFIKKLPQKKTPNFLFLNNGDITFTDNSLKTPNKPSLSNGAIYNDLDNDGDLDIVVNNVNEKATILENTTRQKDTTAHYLNIKFNGATNNRNGIGATIETHIKGEKQYFQNFPTRGYLSSMSPQVFVGFSNSNIIDSLKVLWPDKRFQKLQNIKADQTIIVNYSESIRLEDSPEISDQRFVVTDSLTNFIHKDGTSIEFSRDILVPYASTNLGPHIVAGDLSNDKLDDFILLGAKGQETSLAIQNSTGTFKTVALPDAKTHAIHEDVHAAIFDANGDGFNDIIVVSGGNEFKKGAPLYPRLYIQEEDGIRFRESVFKTPINASKVYAVDVDNDGDLDLSISSNAVPQEFGETPAQYIYENDGKGNFRDITSSFASALQSLGNVYDVSWVDIDADGLKDVIVSGHWMPITILKNTGKKLVPLSDTNLENTSGWWNTVTTGDFDNDGDTDIVAGNFGQNTRLQPSKEQPVRLYRYDFDNNGKIDPIVTYYHQGKETTVASKDELVKQLPFINKKYLSYNAFAKASMTDLLSKEKLNSAVVKEATTFASTYFENNGNNKFTSGPLPFMAQVSAVYDIAADDFNNDGYIDLLLVGNTYEISTQLGRLDGSHGVLLFNDKKGFFTTAQDVNLKINGASRSIEKISIASKKSFVIGRNNDVPLFLQKED